MVVYCAVGNGFPQRKLISSMKAQHKPKHLICNIHERVPTNADGQCRDIIDHNFTEAERFAQLKDRGEMSAAELADEKHVLRQQLFESFDNVLRNVVFFTDGECSFCEC